MSRISSLALAGAGVVVAGLVLFLVVAVGRKPAPRSTTHTPAATPRPHRADAGPHAVQPRPPADAEGPEATPPETAPPHVDPRPNPNANAFPERPPIPADKLSRVPSVGVSALRRAMWGPVRGCGRAMFARAPDKRGRVYVMATVNIAGGKMTLSEIETKQMELDDSELTKCVLDSVKDVSVDAPEGLADGMDRIYLPFSVP
jgi:hypothetical protein